MTLASLRRSLRAAAPPDGAAAAKRFIKTGPGEYGEGDQFLGVRIPDLRKLVRASDSLPDGDVRKLVRSPLHDERMLGFLIWVRRFEQGPSSERRKIFLAYISETKFLNGWDLVDASAPNIVGRFLLENPNERSRLARWARSRSLWERRIAIVSTLTLIRAGVFDPTLTLARSLRNDPEDLIHKATGWMLRELGKRDAALLRAFLQEHAAAMPRTMLRYAIEKFSPEERRRWREAKLSRP